MTKSCTRGIHPSGMDTEEHIIFFLELPKAPKGSKHSDPFHTGGWTGKSPYFFDFWYWRTNSVRSKNKVEAFSGENPYSKLGLLASCKTRTCQKSGFYPEFEDSREVQLGSLAAIGFLLQIRDLLGDIDRFERSVRFKFSRSV